MNYREVRHRFSMKRRILPVLLIFVLTCVISLVLTLISLDVMSSVRAYVAGEGMWSKGQREAVYQLQLYGRTRNPANLKKFEEAIAIPVGYRDARHELLQAHFDEKIVRAGLLQGQTSSEDIPGIIRLFRCCKRAIIFREAFQAWAAGDEFILQLQDFAVALQREIDSPNPSDRRIDAILQEIDSLKERVQPFANAFTASLGKGARAIVAVLSLFTVTVVGLLVCFGSYISWQILLKLQQSEAQYRSLFNAANDAIFIVDRSNDKLLEANPGAERLTGMDAAELHHMRYRDLFSADDVKEPSRRNANEAERDIYAYGNRQTTMHCAGRDIAVDIGGSATVWRDKEAYLAIVRDITGRRKREEELRIAANAMANMLEGVVITDAEWRIVSVNRAFTNITGYAAEEVVGKPMPYPHARNGDKALYRSIMKAVMKSDKWQGELCHQRKNGAVYTIQLSISAVRTDDSGVSHYLFVFDDISASKEYEQRLHQLAHYDPLTNLPNRATFQMQLESAVESAIENNARLALLFIDLDGFKLINDTYGHAAGDFLLQEVARRIHACLRQDDFVARLAGDEFTVLLKNLADIEDASRLARKLLERLSETITFNGKDITVFASIGVSLLPEDASDAQTLLMNADTAMYEAKHQGRNNFQMFMPWMIADASSRLQLAGSLKHAIARGELELHYQPCVNIDSRRIASLEALLRWNHPQLGSVSPNIFIPLAEEIGLIGSITDWVLRAACRQGMDWLEKGYPPVQLDVNISPCNFWDARLPETIAKVLDETSWQAKWLCLEITETAMANQEKSKAMLKELSAMGMQLAIDDFGIGYSSLSYLKDFPVHYLKIDRSFTISSVLSASNASITRAIIAVAKGLNLSVIAEGVETAAQEAFLRAEGCDQVQGYFFARPMPAHQLEPILADMDRIDRI